MFYGPCHQPITHVYVNLMIQRITNSILPNTVLVYYCLQILWLYSDSEGTTEVRQACLVMVIKPINLNSEFTGMEFTAKFILCSDPLPHVQCQACMWTSDHTSIPITGPQNTETQVVMSLAMREGAC